MLQNLRFWASPRRGTDGRTARTDGLTHRGIILSELSLLETGMRISERIIEMSEIASLTKSKCFSRKDACMKGPRASNKSWRKCTRVLRTPFSLALRKWETQVTKWIWNLNLSRITHFGDWLVCVAMWNTKKCYRMCDWYMTSVGKGREKAEL